MKIFFAIGFIAVCALVHHSDGEPKNSVRGEQKTIRSVMAQVGVEILDCMQNETIGCISCFKEGSCNEELELSPTTPCPKDCLLGCMCEDGYVRAPKDNCIFEEDCPDY